MHSSLLRRPMTPASPARGMRLASVGLLTLGLVAGSIAATPAVASSTGAPSVAAAAVAKSYIAGRVLGPDGKPAAGRVIQAEPVGEDPGPVTSDTTDSKGRYRLGPLPAGDYAPVVLDPKSPGTRQYLGGSTDIYLARTITVTGAAATVTRELRMAKRAAATGVLKTASGALARNVTVVAQQLDGTKTLTRDFGSRKSVLTDSNGVYKFSDLNPGSYTMTFGKPTTSVGSPVSVSLRLPAGTTTRSARLKAPVPPATTDPDVTDEPGLADVAAPTISAPDGLSTEDNVYAVTDYPGLDPEQSRYQWMRDGRPLTLANGDFYLIHAADVGGVLTFQFSGVANGEPIGPITSEPSGVIDDQQVDIPIDSPEIYGTGRVGDTLTADPDVTPEPGVTYTYQWYLNGYPLVGQTLKTYVPRIQDFGQTISVVLEAHDANGPVAGGGGTLGVPIKAAKALKLEPGRMLVGGKAGAKLYLGGTLSAPVTGLPSYAVGVAYQWQVDRGFGWRTIVGATDSTFTLSTKSDTTSHVGYRYRVVTTVERAAYAQAAPVPSKSKTVSSR